MFKVFYADEYGEVHFIKEEFESILNEVYNAGYHDGLKSKQNIWTSPITWSNNKPYCGSDSINIRSTGFDSTDKATLTSNTNKEKTNGRK